MFNEGKIIDEILLNESKNNYQILLKKENE